MRRPRLVVRTMAATFITVAVILSVVFVVLMLAARERARAAFARAELQRGAGSDFDAPSVEALLTALPTAPSIAEPELQALLGRRV